MKFKTGDTVQVIAGNDKGRTGEVLRILAKQDRVVVQGVNLRWKHRKPTQQSPQGSREQEECPVHVSNVMPVDPASGKPTRKSLKARG